MGKPETMNKKNRKYWCSLHILPMMLEFTIEMKAYNEVT